MPSPTQAAMNILDLCLSSCSTADFTVSSLGLILFCLLALLFVPLLFLFLLYLTVQSCPLFVTHVITPVVKRNSCSAVVKSYAPPPGLR